MKTNITFTRIAGGIMAALLAITLAGCAGSSDDGGDPGTKSAKADQTVYEITGVDDVPFAAPGPVVVRLPKGLVDVAPEAQNLYVDSYEISARQLDSSSCVLDAALSWTDEDALAEALAEFNDTEKESVELISDEDFEKFKDQPKILNHWPTLPTDIDSEQERFAKRFGLGDYVDGLTLVDVVPDDEALEPGTYLVADFHSITFVTECAVSPDETSVPLNFPIRNDAVGDDLTSLWGGAMADGTVILTEQGVDGYEVDTAGTWLAE